MVRFEDLMFLLKQTREFERTENVEELPIDEIEIVCERVLASDPLEHLAFRMIPIIEHAREIAAPED